MTDEDLDGWRKNVQVLKEEWDEIWPDFKRNWSRLMKPSLNPKNREHFVPHVLKAFISTFFGMRRILTEIVTWAIVAWILITLSSSLWRLLSAG